jgi:hypothetical protein
MEKSLTPAYKDLTFPNWYVSLSFVKSSSPNYPQAVALAKRAPSYLEHYNDGQLLHQAVYSEKPQEYLQFVHLYELVRTWKGHYVIIKGEVVDRKIISGLNYCYGDRCRSSNPEFCFGASYMTDNPFGCHRMQISSCNHPWWTFTIPDKYGRLKVDKAALLKRMTEYSAPYRLCPAFNWDRAVKSLQDLPDYITPKQSRDFREEGASVGKITINLGPETSSKKSGCGGCGCGSMLTLGLIILMLLLVI